MRTIDASATSSAPPAVVWGLLSDVSSWSIWGSWSRVEMEDGAAHGPGAVRVVVKAPLRLRERVTEWVPEERMAYELLEGMRVRGYRAVVTLEPTADDGTLIRWQATYEHAGPLSALILRFAIPDACRRLARAASAAVPPAPEPALA